MTVFIDTSVWYAAVDADDYKNSSARKILKGIDHCITSDHVVLETWRLLQHRLGWNVAEQFWAGIRSGISEIEHVLPIDMEAAWKMGSTFRDQGFSLTDRTSFAVMQRLGLSRAASFDKDFSVFRYGVGNKHAFEIVA